MSTQTEIRRRERLNRQLDLVREVADVLATTTRTSHDAAMLSAVLLVGLDALGDTIDGLQSVHLAA